MTAPGVKTGANSTGFIFIQGILNFIAVALRGRREQAGLNQMGNAAQPTHGICDELRFCGKLIFISDVLKIASAVLPGAGVCS